LTLVSEKTGCDGTDRVGTVEYLNKKIEKQRDSSGFYWLSTDSLNVKVLLKIFLMMKNK